MRKIIYIALMLVFVTTVNESPAGYIRPGGGNDVVQIIISSIISIGAFFKSLANKIKSLFCGTK